MLVLLGVIACGRDDGSGPRPPDASVDAQHPTDGGMDARISDAATDAQSMMDARISDAAMDAQSVMDARISDAAMDATLPDAANDASDPDATAGAQQPDATGGNECPHLGSFTVMPAVSYDCQDTLLGSTVFTIDLSSVSFSSSDGIFEASSPALDAVLTQDPAPTDCTFDLQGTSSGGCAQDYRLTGSFDGSGGWSGTLYIDFRGPDCAYTNCTDTMFAVSGTR